MQDSTQKISPETMEVLNEEREKQRKAGASGKDRSFRKLIEVAVLEKYK